MAGWDTSDRRAGLPSDWAKRVKLVWERDKGRCRWLLPRSGKRCPRPGADVDHRYGPDRHEVGDLWLLCRKHHDDKTARESWMGKKKRRPVKRALEQHPGLRRA